MRLMHILLVEDDESIREVLKLILETDPPVPDLSVDTASNGSEALKSAKARRPDVVLLDLTLPGEHGFEVFKKLRATPGCKDVPVLAVSAHAAHALEKETLEIGFTSYVAKPIDFENCLFPLLQQLDKKRKAA